MMIKDYKKLFKAFVQPYLDKGEEAFQVKVAHTGDVVSIITQLGIGLKLDSRQLMLAKLTALFHDLGRFPQYDKYKTFNDKISMDHSQESARILAEQGFIGSLPVNDQELITTAILEHNKKFVSEGLTTNVLALSLLIRDADKLSNFPLFLKNYDRFIVPSTSIYKEEFIRLILSKTPIDNSSLQTIEDYYLYHLSWFNDLNYGVSINFATNESYIDKIIQRITAAEIRDVLTNHFDTFKSESSLLNNCEF